MKVICAVTFYLFSQPGYARPPAAAMKTDLEVLCELNKLEKSLLKDKSLNTADIAERLASMKEAGFRAPETKEALKAISHADPKEANLLWKEFAKENKVRGVTYL